jgi:hypothetical protein
MMCVGYRAYRRLATEVRPSPDQATAAPEEERTASFERSYRLGASLLGGARAGEGALSPDLDTATGGGHLMMACRDYTLLAEPPATILDAKSAAAFDVQAPAPGELALLHEPVAQLQARLVSLLEEYPEHPTLQSLAVICDRLQGKA